MRASLSETLDEDYMTTARAIGFSPTTRRLRHAIPNALLPVIALTAIVARLRRRRRHLHRVGVLVAGNRAGSPTTRCRTTTCRCCRASSCVSSAAVILMNLVADLVIIMALDPRVRAR